MLLIGMFDSPFVRRVAVTLTLLDLPFEHLNWSVGADHQQILRYSPLGRVPTLVLDDGEVLTESAAILDHLDSVAGPERALTPPMGPDRRAVLQFVALAIGAAEKGREQIYERVFRPAEKRHEPWLDRCRMQMHGALQDIEQRRVGQGAAGWLVGPRMTQADITLTCAWTFLCESVALEEARYPAVSALAARCEALPAFAATRAPWTPPKN